MKNKMNKKILLFTQIILLYLFQSSKISYLSSDSDISVAERAAVETEKHEDGLAITSRIPSFGFRNIRANSAFVSFLQYFGDDELRSKNGYSLSPEFFKVIIPNDPYYKNFYVFLTNSVSLSAAEPTISVELMEQGLELLEKHRLEDSFYIWRYKAVDELLFLNDTESAKQSFRRAAEWARTSNLPESELMASISKQTADFLEQNPDSKAAQIGAWSSVLTTAVDDGTRERAIEGIQALGGEVIVHEDGGIEIKYAQVEQDAES